VGQKTQKPGQRKNPIGGCAILHHITVKGGAKRNVAGIGQLVGGNDARAQRTEGVEVFSERDLVILELNIPSGDIVQNRVSKD
jgi:hypothetical protein